jgi:hypothetical protein
VEIAMRFVAIGNFLFAIIMFFLPWIDVRCEMGAQQSKSLVEQSGYQIAVGETSEGDAFKDAEREFAKVGGMGGAKMKRNDEFKKLKTDAVPLLWGFVGLLGAGAVLCLVIPGKAWRTGALIGALGAGAVLGIQTAQGFPIEKKFKDEMEKDKDNQPKAKGNADLDLGIGAPRIVVTYKPGYYLAWSMCLLPLLWVAIDAMIRPLPPLRKRGRDRDRDDEDDERDDSSGRRGRPRDDYDDDRRNPFKDD